MSFLEQIKQIIISAFSLQTQIKKHTDKHHLIFPRIKRKKRNCKPFVPKRISSVISITHEGSLTIEAALVIPIFLFAIIAVLSFTDILRLQMKTDSAMAQCAKELAVYGYAQESLLGEAIDDIPFGVETLFSESYVRNRVISELGKDYLSGSPAGGSGAIHFVGSRIMEDDRIELRSVYYVTPFFALSPKSGFLTGTCAVARAFTGYDNLSAVSDTDKEEFVFITPEGTAYHKSRSCHYLDLSIEKVFMEDISGIRNKDGSIYYACPLCKGAGNGTTVFVTDYGNRYHRDVLCSGLKRTVEMVPISETGGRHPCSKCCN